MTAGAIERRLTVGGLGLEALELQGDPHERPLVLLHEGLGSVGLWRDFPAALQDATGRRVLAFSRFGHGRSDRRRGRARPRSSTRRRSRCCRGCSSSSAPSSPMLVGHSDGGSIALIHAGRHPVDRHRAARPARDRRGRHRRGDPRGARGASTPAGCASGWRATTTTPTPRSTAGATSGSIPPSARGASSPTPRASPARRCSIQGAEDPYGTLEQLDRIEARVRGPVRAAGRAGGPQPAPRRPRAGPRRARTLGG